MCINVLMRLDCFLIMTAVIMSGVYTSARVSLFEIRLIKIILRFGFLCCTFNHTRIHIAAFLMCF